MIHSFLTDGLIWHVFGMGRPITCHYGYMYLSRKRPLFTTHMENCLQKIPFFKKDSFIFPNGKKHFEWFAVFRILVWYMDRVKRIWNLSPMRAAKVQASRAEPARLAHTSSESRRTFRQKARSLAQLNGLACAVEICHDGMLEDTNSLDGAHITIHTNSTVRLFVICHFCSCSCWEDIIWAMSRENLSSGFCDQLSL